MAKQTRDHVAVDDGNFGIVKINASQRDWRDVYHWLLTLRWPSFVGVLIGIYLVVNVVFAVLYSVGETCIDSMPSGSFQSAFFFSVETLATVGYGHMYPVTFYGHLVVTLEIMIGMFGTAVMTGLIFVRFSRPTARLVFSRVLVLAPFDGQPALMMRVANQRHQPMVEAQFHLMLIRHEPTLEDATMRRFHVLPLQVNRLISFPAAITMRHLIDERSPLYGQTREDFERSDVRFFASVVCLDQVLQAPIQSDQRYTWRDVRFGDRFAEMYREDGHGRLLADYALLHHTEPESAAAAPAPGKTPAR